MKIIFQDERRVIVSFPKLGDVTLSKFSGSFDHGLYKEKPWHVCGQGRNFATVDECIAYCQTIVDNWDKEEPISPSHHYYHAEQTNAFQRHEALLDSCPW